MEKTGRQKPSLRGELGAIVLACWVLPVLVTLGVTGWYIANRLTSQVTQAVQSSVINEAETTKIRLESAITASRNASYYATPKEALYAFEETGDRIHLYDQINVFLTQQYKYDEKFLTTLFFYVNEPDQVYHTYNDWFSSTYTGVQSYMQQAHETVKSIYPALGAEVRFLAVGERLYLVRALLDYNRGFEPYAVLVMELNQKMMFDGLHTVVWSTGGAVWLGDTRVSLSNDAKPFMREAPAVSPGEMTMKEMGGATVIAGSCMVDRLPMRYMLSVDRQELMRDLNMFQQIVLLLLLLGILPLLALAVWFFYRTISRPIGGLVSAAGRIERGELGYQIEGESHNREFQYLNDAFNSMSAQLKSQFERIYSEELALRDARIMALQSQINPHFLNNTLEIINWEARLADNLKVSRMIEALSTMLDAAMDRGGKPVVRLAEEMMYVDAYLYIITERLGKRLKIVKEIDEKLLDRRVPRLVLQPIIENAVEHGVQTRQQGIIAIRAREEEGNLLLEIENDGSLTDDEKTRVTRLLSAEQIPARTGSASLGIRNVNQRLRILYGEQSGLHIFDDGRGHVVAQIKIVESLD